MIEAKWNELLSKDDETLGEEYDLPVSETWVRNGVDLELVTGCCLEDEFNRDLYETMITEMMLQKMVYFCSTLNVDFAGEGNIRRLMDITENYNMDVSNLLLLPKDVFEDAIGINGIKFYNSLHKAVNEVDICKFMDATGAFGQGIGELKLQKIYDVYKELPFDKNKVLEVEGWAEKTAEQYMSQYVYAITWVEFLAKELNKTFEYKEVEVKSNDYNGLAVVFTGIRDKEMEQIITENGGKVLSGVSKNCNLVITKDVNSSSSKIVKAKSLGIEVISYNEALERFK